MDAGQAESPLCSLDYIGKVIHEENQTLLHNKEGNGTNKRRDHNIIHAEHALVVNVSCRESRS